MNIKNKLKELIRLYKISKKYSIVKNAEGEETLYITINETQHVKVSI